MFEIETLRGKLSVSVCDSPDSPRNWCNAFRMSFVWDSLDGIDELDCGGDGDRLNAIGKAIEDEGGVVMPIYVYEHSGIAVSLGNGHPFDCPWDSGCGGIAAIDKAALDDEFGGDRDKAISCLACEIQTLNEYLNGGVVVVEYKCYLSGDEHCVGDVYGIADEEDAINFVRDNFAVSDEAISELREAA